MFAALLPFVLAPLASGQAAAAQSAGLTQPDPSSPSGIVAAAPTGDWVTIAADDLLVMELAPDVAGHARRVVIQLMPAPFSQGWVANIRTLARAHWWDGLSINRVQDNYVAQWGDAEGESAHPKPLPGRLTVMTESDYALTLTAADRRHFADKAKQYKAKMLAAFRLAGAAKVRAISLAIPRDPYADETDQYRGWPVARDNRSYWPVHCYAMVGVGRNLSPDTGSGAELYAVIGHAPRHLDRNIALVGRVVEGIEYLSSLPRGTEALGFYRTSAERTAIRSVRLASELPAGERPRLQYLSTESVSFAAYANARANRHDAFFIRPAGGADVCNIPVPVRPVPGGSRG